MKHFVIARADGGVSIFPANGDPEATFAAWQTTARPDWLPAIMRSTDGAIPSDRTFRDAWKNAAAGNIDVDMPKAREIHKNRLRARRKPMLEALDIEYQRADEAEDAAEKARVASEKQALRDVTAVPAIEAATTPAELKAVMPAALGAGQRLG